MMAHTMSPETRPPLPPFVPLGLSGLVLASGTLAPVAFAAPPEAGTAIENTGTVTFYNSALGLTETARSNTVQTRVNPVAAFTVRDDQSYVRAPGEPVLFSFTIENTGNTSLDLEAGFTLPGGDFAFADVVAVIDVDGDGQIGPADTPLDPGMAVTLPIDGAVAVLVGLLVPAEAGIGETAAGVLSAWMASGGAASSAQGEVVVEDMGLTLTKSVSDTAAAAGETLVYTLRLANNTTRDFDPATVFDGRPLILDGVASEAILVADDIPLNTRFAGIVDAVDYTAVYRRHGDAPERWTRAAPADPAEIAAVGFLSDQPLPAGFSRDFQFAVALSPNTAGLTIDNVAAWLAPGDATGLDPVPSNRVTTRVAAGSGGGGGGEIVFTDGPGGAPAPPEAGHGEDIFIETVSALCNASTAVDTIEIVVTSAPEGDRETVRATETGPNTGVFRSGPLAVGAAPPVIQGDGVLQGARRSVATARTTCDPDASAQLTIAPAGAVFSSVDNEPIAGALVELLTESGAVLASVITDADGLFQIRSDIAGIHTVRVTPPGEFTAPSGRRDFAGFGRIIDPDGSFAHPFQLAGDGRTLLLDIPVDPDLTGGLVTEKTSTRRDARIADHIDYTVTVTNASSLAITGAEVVDRLPVGFAYVTGSARLDGEPVADPERREAGALVFSLGRLEPGAEAGLTYFAEVLPTSGDGEKTNRALARGRYVGFDRDVTSNTARHSVRIDSQGGVFSRDGVVLGKVFLDCDGDGVQSNADGAEPGIPGVQIHTEEGFSVVTDGKGRYSLPGLSPSTHVLDLYEPTLPPGTEAVATRTLDAGRAGSRFVPLKAGEIRSEDFALRPAGALACSAQLRDDLRARITGFDQAALGMPGPMTPLQLDRVRQGRSGDYADTVETAMRAGRAAPDAVPGAGKTSGALAIPATLALEPLIAGRSDAPGFLDLVDGTHLSQRVISVRVAGPAGTGLSLMRNGTPVAAERIGQRVEANGVQAIEYVAVALKAGANTFTLTETDPFGNLRSETAITVTAPGEPAGVRLIAPAEAIADASSPVPVTIQVVDAAGHPVAAPVEVTLVAREDRFDARDASPQRPGLQTLLRDGQTTLQLFPGETVGSRIVRVDSPLGSAEARIRFTADTHASRIAVGFAEATIGFGRSGEDALHDRLEADEISPFEDTEEGVEGAVYLKGRVLGDSLLTFRYDSDRELEDALFRSVEPDEFYPVYGDQSERGFDARSRGRLFAKLERDASYILFGDVAYDASAEAIQLGRFQRTLEGARAHLDTGRLRLDVYAGETETGQVVREIPSLGISGPYDLDTTGVIENSETVEMLVRDRNQPGVILETRRLSRFTDYTLDYFTGALVLARPLPLRDPDFNPVSLRVTLETGEDAGEAYAVYGGELAFDLTDWMSAGLRQLSADAPVGSADRRTVQAAYVDARLGADGRLQVEAARSDTGDGDDGEAVRLSYEHRLERGSIGARAAMASEDFNAPGASVSSGRDEARVYATLGVGPGQLSGEALYTGESDSGAARYGAVGRYEVPLSDTLRVRTGGRYVHSEDTAGEADTALTAIAGLAWAPSALPGAALDLEVEQEVTDGTESRFTVGADYAVTPKLRLYAQGLWSASRSGDFGFTDGRDDVSVRAGGEYRWSENLTAFTEYRAEEDFFDAGLAQGLSARWAAAPSLSLRARIEHVQPLAPDFRRNTAAGVGATWEPESRAWIADGDLDYAVADNGQISWYASTTLGHRRGDHTILLRNRYASSTGEPFGRTRDRLRLGHAYRPDRHDDFNTLAWYEFEHDDRGPRSDSRHTWSFGGERKSDARTRVRARLAGQVYRFESVEAGPARDTLTWLTETGLDHDITRNWTVGVNLAGLGDDGLDNWTYGIGGEATFVPIENALIGLGYNHTELEEDQVRRLYRAGWFLRLRIKLDQSAWTLFDR